MNKYKYILSGMIIKQKTHACASVLDKVRCRHGNCELLATTIFS